MTPQEETDRYTYLKLKQKQASGLAQQGAKDSPTSLQDQVPGIIKQAGQAAFASRPENLTQNFMQTDPATMQRVGGGALPVIGGVFGGPIGASIGEVGREMTGTVFAPDTVPKTPLGIGASVIGSGVMENPKIIPGATTVGKMAGKLGSRIGNSLANTVEAYTGAPAKSIKQGFQQGLPTYLDPSMEKAKGIFADALGPEGQAAMKQSAKEAFDPALTQARNMAIEMGTRLENGEAVSAIDALKARQATDRVISATSKTDGNTLHALYDWRDKFDDVITASKGELADASRTYRKGIVKDNLTTLLRMTKQGRTSAVGPMVAALQGSPLRALGYLAQSSPMVAGLAATSAGSAIKGLNTIGSNPAARQALFQVLQRLATKKAQEQPPAVNGVRG